MRQSIEDKPLVAPESRAYDAIIPSVVRVVGLMTEGDDGSDSKENGTVERGVGTGVVIIDNGTILTNLHVVSGAKKIRVTFFDGSESDAMVLSTQPENDLAVLRAKTIPDDLEAATMRSTADLASGDHVLAVGFPFGIGPSASAGVVSGPEAPVPLARRPADAHQPDPVRRRRQPGQLGRPAGDDGRRGGRHRHRDPEPEPPARLHRHRLRRADRERRRGGGNAAVLDARAARSVVPPAHAVPLSPCTGSTMTDTSSIPGDAATLMERVLYEVKRVVVGQDHFLERVMVAVLAQGHLLVEGVPGLAKTLTVKTLAQTLRGTFKRIQFTPDLVPADLVGTRIFNPRTGEFSTSLGPVFTHLLLADEINRAPAKVQSALLEVMQERQVTIAGETHKVPEPFLVMATQNPIETEGTYPLPEAQVDRFMMKVLVDYPNEEEEFVIAQRVTGTPVTMSPVASMGQLAELQQECRKVYVDPSLMQYAVKLVSATRRPERYELADIAKFLTFGASPRATIGLIEGARALAFMRGRSYALPEDMTGLVGDVLRHRLVLSYEALAEGIDADAVIQKVMRKIPVPDKPLAPENSHGRS